jgi:hypothetical protein
MKIKLLKNYKKIEKDGGLYKMPQEEVFINTKPFEKEKVKEMTF